MPTRMPSARLLATETTGATETGLAGPDFAVYRDGAKVATVTDSTNYADAVNSMPLTIGTTEYSEVAEPPASA